MPTTLSLNNWMSLYFFVAAMFSIFLLKAQSLYLSRPKAVDWKSIAAFFFLTPLPSYNTWKRSKEPSRYEVQEIFKQGGIYFFVFCSYFYFYWVVRDSANPPSLVWSYLAAPLVWLLGEWLTAIMQIVCLASGRVIPPHHQLPIVAKNLTDFWEKRWNNWFHDWFHQGIFKVVGKRPVRAIMATFLVSGIGHELVISLPYYILTKENVFGTMTAFFVLQGLGVVLDNKIFKKSQKTQRRAFLWIWILATMPLFMNDATMRLIHAVP